MGAGCCGGGGHDGPVAKPSFNEEQESVAKWIRWYVKTKNAPVKGGEKVDWFTGQGKNARWYNSRNLLSRIPTVKLKIPGKAFLESEFRTSVTFKL